MSDHDAWLALSSELFQFAQVRGVLSPAEFAAADLVLFVGPITKNERALELVGAMKLALESGATFVFLYYSGFEAGLRRSVSLSGS